jgi:deoxyribonuclease-4
MRIGRHMPTGSKPVRAAEIARRIGCDAIQIFASNPTAWKPPSGLTTESEAFALAARALDLDPVVLHAPYLINLGAPDDDIWDKSISLLTWTLQRAALLGARYVVVHTGSHRGAGVEAGCARVAEGITRVLSNTPADVMLLLENDVGAGHSLGADFQNIATILNYHPAEQQRLGVCLDTAHLWGAGYDLSTPEDVASMLSNFSAIIDLQRLKVLHLNDTKKALGSHRDAHARLGEGIIPAEGLRALLRDPRLSHMAALMETPVQTTEDDKEDWEHDATQISYARALATPDQD